MGLYPWLTVTSPDGIAADVQHLAALGARFRGEPRSMGPVMAAVFEDACGDLVNLVQPAA
jgi:hypothetical protein